MKKTTYWQYGIDLVMAIIFVLLFNSRVLGGLPFHELAGLGIGVIFLTHILLNWRWVKNITVRLFDKKLPGKTRLGYVLNLLLLISMSFIIFSGIGMSRVVFPDLYLGNQRWFEITHISVSFLTLILVAAHVGLHWKWVVDVSKRIVPFFAMKKPVLGIVAKVATVALLVFGTFQMLSTDFFGQLRGVTAVFSPSTSSFPFGEEFERGEHHGFPDRDFDRDEEVFFPNGGFDQGERWSFAEEGFERGDRGFFHEEGFGEHDRFGGPSALSVIITYFGIMSVFIILVYYLDKWIRKSKRKKDLPSV